MEVLSSLVTFEENPCIVSSLLIAVLFTWKQRQLPPLSKEMGAGVTLWEELEQ